MAGSRGGDGQGNSSSIGWITVVLTAIGTVAAVCGVLVAVMPERNQGSPGPGTVKTTSTNPAQLGAEPAASVTTDVQAAQPETVYLYDTPVTSGAVSDPGPHSLSGRIYEHSFKTGCYTSDFIGVYGYASWSTVGFVRLSAVIGIDDNEPNAVAKRAHIRIEDQNGHNLTAPFYVELGKPRRIDIKLKDVVQIRMGCDEGDYGGISATFGDAALHR